MIQVIEHKGFSAVATAHARDGYGDVVYLSIAGTETATRAIWAALSERERVSLGDGSITLERGQKYKTIRQRVQGDHGPVFTRTLLHPNATVLSHDPPLYFIAPEDHGGSPPGFFERLNLAVPVPKLKEWESWLWEGGQKGITVPRPDTYASDLGYSRTTSFTLIQPIDAFGVRAWKVYTRADGWHAVIRKHLGLRVNMQRIAHGYVNGSWAIFYNQDKDELWKVYHNREIATFRKDGEVMPCQHKDLEAVRHMALVELGVELHIEEDH